MKKYYKAFNGRVNKFAMPMLIILSVLLVIGVISNCYSWDSITNSNNVELFTDTLQSTTMIKNPEAYYAFILSIVAAILIAVIAVRMNDIKYYLPQGARKSSNIAMNVSSAVVITVAVSIMFVLIEFISKLIMLATHSDYIIFNSLFSALKLKEIFVYAGLILLISLASYFVICCIYKLYSVNKSVVFVSVALFVAFVTSFFFIGSNFIPTNAMLFITSINGIAIISSAILFLALGTYSAVEMLTEVRE